MDYPAHFAECAADAKETSRWWSEPASGNHRTTDTRKEIAIRAKLRRLSETPAAIDGRTDKLDCRSIAEFHQNPGMAVRDVATSPENYRAAAGGYLAEIDRMMLEVRDYLWAPPAKVSGELATV